MIVIPKRAKDDKVVWTELTQKTISTENPLHVALVKRIEALDCEQFFFGTKSLEEGDDLDPSDRYDNSPRTVC